MVNGSFKPWLDYGRLSDGGGDDMAAERLTGRDPVPPRAGLARTLCDILLVAPSQAGGLAARLVFSSVVCLAVLPWLHWSAPVAWLALMTGLAIVERRLSLRPPPEGRRQPGGRNLFAWLQSAGYAAVAFYLTLVEDGAAQTLGVTLFGVVMFEILAREYGRPRRLVTNLTPMLAAMALVQIAACLFMLERGEPWGIVTVVATAYLVFRAFRSVQADLTKARRGLAEASARATADARTIRESQRIAEMAEAMAGVGHWRIQMATGATSWSEGVYRIYGMARTEKVPRLDVQLAQYSEEDRDRLRANLRGTIDRGEPFKFEGPITRTDGSVRHVVCHGAAELDASGAVETLYGALMDVTDARAREEALRDAKQRAEAAAEAKAEFLANMSHEIRTPLTAINGFSTLLGGLGDLSPTAGAYVRRINAAGLTLLAVVNDILDFSKLEAGQIATDPQPFAARPFFDDLTAMFAEQAEAKGVDLRLEIADDVPEALETDSGRLRQIVVNLVGNAIKFTETGEVCVTVGYDAARECVEVAVSDTGCGVPEDKRGELFQRFSQVDGSVSRRHGGTGLGLSICKGLVELLGGTIGMAPAPAGGSIFRFELPAPAATLDATEAGDNDDFVEAPAARVLVVDDLDTNRELVRAMLQAVGHQVEEADSGPAALRLAAEQAYDLILMDLQMPGMDGFASARAIRSLPNTNHDTPIIALSADVLPEHIGASAEAGMNGHLGKPISPLELIGAVHRWAGVRIAGEAA